MIRLSLPAPSPVVASLALRNLFRQKLRAALTLGAVAVGVRR